MLLLKVHLVVRGMYHDHDFVEVYVLSRLFDSTLLCDPDLCGRSWYATASHSFFSFLSACPSFHFPYLTFWFCFLIALLLMLFPLLFLLLFFSVLDEEKCQKVAIEALCFLLCSKRVDTGKKRGVNPIGFIFTQHSVSKTTNPHLSHWEMDSLLCACFMLALCWLLKTSWGAVLRCVSMGTI